MKGLINLRDESVQIRMDLPLEDFKYFTNIIQNNVLNEWVENKRIDKIKECIESYMSDTYKQLYIVVVGQDPAYNLSYKKNRSLIIKMSHVTIFIYVPKPSEFPALGRMHIYSPKSNTVQFIKQSNLSDSEFLILDKVQAYLQGIVESVTENESLETLIVTKLKPKLCVSFKGGYWHVFCSKKVNIIVTQEKHERFLEFQVNQGQVPLKVIAFQKQGPKFNIFEKLKLRTRELISFIVLLIFFATLVGCKEKYDEDSAWGKSQVRQEICSHRSQVLGFSAVILFGLLAQRMIKKYIDKGKKKSKVQ